jgi:D-amino-acid oxidase
MSTIAVIGAGVSGLTCAVTLAESGHRTVVFAEERRDTTSRAAAAIWFPYDAEPFERVIAWARETYDVLKRLSRFPESGVSMIELKTFTREQKAVIPDWAVQIGARRLRPGELSLKGSARAGTKFRDGFALVVPLTDTTIYLDYLANRFVRAGGRIEAQHLDMLDQVGGEFNAVVNCAGIGARDLAGDSQLEPHRGQVVLVSRIPMSGAVVCDDMPLMYAVPRRADCLLGGTNTVSENSAPDSRDTAAILRECSAVLGIHAPRILEARVGLRPYRRTGVRLERMKLRDGRAVVHNYGHGGSGFTLSWGCAREVCALI